MDAPTVTFIAFATAPGSVAEDGPGRNGMFTGRLLQNMETPGLKMGAVLKRVCVGVMQDTGRRQVP